MKIWFEMKLWKQVFIGLVAGVIVGVVFGEKASYVKPLGDIFIRLIQMIIVPLIFFSLVSGLTGMTDKVALSRVAIKSVVAFLTTTSLAITIGMVAAILFEPGVGISVSALHSADFKLPEVGVRVLDLTTVVNDMIPNNALSALVTGNILQVVFFSIFTGVILNMLGKDGESMVKALKVGARLVFKMISVIMHFAPYGAFALTASVVGKQGLSALQNLSTLVFTLISAMAVQYIIFGILIAIFGRISPFPFYKKSLEYQALAFSTSSSKATLPTTMNVCLNKMGISKNSTSFILPLGAAINMDGMAIYLGICTMFFVQIYGIQLTTLDYAIIMLTSTLGSIGAAGIPGGTLIMLPMVLAALNLPIEGIAFIAGIDRVLDMMRTTINITGDATITLIIDSSEGTLNKKLYNTPSSKISSHKELLS
jgi:Na+/H+-dicarboxylate symporter